MIIKPISWSFTSLEHAKQCLRSYHEIRVLKNFKEKEGEELLWGNRVHAAFAEALTKGTPLPLGMELWEPLIDKFRTVRGTLYVEQQYALTQGYQPCNWRDWDNAWVRAIVDALWIHGPVAKAVDWKTGKRKPKSDQLALIALHIFHHYPEVQEVRTMFMWLKTMEKDEEKYVRDDIPKLWQLFALDLKKLKYAFDHDEWPATTNGLCRSFCPVLTCSFNGRSPYATVGKK